MYGPTAFAGYKLSFPDFCLGKIEPAGIYIRLGLAYRSEGDYLGQK